MDLHKFAHGKYVAKMCKLRSSLEIRGKDGCQFCLLMTTTASKPQENDREYGTVVRLVSEAKMLLPYPTLLITCFYRVYPAIIVRVILPRVMKTGLANIL